MQAVAMKDADPRAEILKAVGDISDIEVFNKQILVAVYIAPEKTKGGIIRPASNVDEDRYQSKVGLILKMGPIAGDPSSPWFDGLEHPVSVGDWIVYRPSEGWSITVNRTFDGGVLCRMLDDEDVRGRIQSPDMVW